MAARRILSYALAIVLAVAVPLSALAYDELETSEETMLEESASEEYQEEEEQTAEETAVDDTEQSEEPIIEEAPKSSPGIQSAELPITPFAAAATLVHPVTEWYGVKFYPGSSMVTQLAPSSISYDIVVLRYVQTGTTHYYRFYFCKNSEVKYDEAKAKHTAVNVNGKNTAVPIIEVAYEPGSSFIQYKTSMDYYPVSVGYNRYFSNHLRTDESDINKQIEIVWNATEFPYIHISEAEKPPPPPPDPPPPVDPPPPPPPPVPPMVIPPHNPEMVPWDGERMSDFFKYVSAAMGNAVNTGLAIFGIILAVYVMIRIMITFENTSGSGG